MANISYYNGYKFNSSRNVELFDVNGRQVMQVWTNPMSFETQRERNEYFANEHSEHCLSVEMDIVDGGKYWVFFYDDAPANISPIKILPSDEELISILENYNG